MLSQKMRNKYFVYLDSAATSLKPRQVIQAEAAYYEEFGVNIHRGLYEFSETATRLYAETRKKVASYINAPDEAEIIFTHGSTESSNLVAYGWGRKFLKKGDVILSTDVEHHSSLVPWHAVCKATGAELSFIPLNPDTQELDLDRVDALLAKGVKLVVVSAMANATGYMPPIAEIAKKAHSYGAIVCVDGAQSVSHRPVDVRALDCDLLIFSAHKMLGPTGVGVLYGKRSVLEQMDPFMYGGDMIVEVHRDVSVYQPIPEKFEAGTPNIAGVIGFSAALDYLSTVGAANIETWEKHLQERCIEQASQRPWLKRYGPVQELCGGIFSFNADGIHSHDMGTLLDSQGIAVRTGFQCAMPYMEKLRTGGTVRASWYFYNTEDDIDRLFAGIDRAREIFS